MSKVMLYAIGVAFVIIGIALFMKCWIIPAGAITCLGIAAFKVAEEA